MFDLFDSFLDDGSLFDSGADDWNLNLTEQDISDDLFPFLESPLDNGGAAWLDLAELPDTVFSGDEIAIPLASADFGNVLDDLWSFIDLFFPSVEAAELNLVGIEQFTHDGQFDPINQCIVEGNVVSDISFLQRQTGQTCSLMAQEQFVARMTGNHIPEGELERLALEMGVYDPNLGTFSDGWNAILDHYGVENTKYFNTNTNMLETATRNGDDVLIGVDARVFYNDPTFPPGSGHAVTIVGRGMDPVNGQLTGYYITDSNCPGQAHFKTVAELEYSWDYSMITVPTSITA